MEFLTQGYHQSVEQIVNGALFESDNDEMVLVKNIELYSLCEHHLLAFHWQMSCGLSSQWKNLGLSKIARIVDMYARRLQVQENLTKKLPKRFTTSPSANGVGVIIEAQHLCMMMRGVEKQNSIMRPR